MADFNQVQVEIPARLYWVNTGISVQAGKKYQFHATGIWTDWFIETNADGHNRSFMRWLNFLKRSPENNWFALIGSLNQRDYFLIGQHRTIQFDHDGELYCFANDVPGFYWNNKGSIILTILS